MYYGNDLQESSSDGNGNSDESNSYYSDTLNQILLPVTLIFVYMIALMAADLIDVRYQFKRLMEKWEKTDKNMLIIQLEKQVIIEAFEKIKKENQKYLGLDLLESGNYDFNIELSDNGSIKILELMKLSKGKKEKIQLLEYGNRIKISLSTKKNREIEKKELYKKVLDAVDLMDSGRGWFLYKTDESYRNAIDIENAKYLQNELIVPYLDNTENVIIEFQIKLIEELGKYFNRRLDVWEKWDPDSYKKFKNITSLIRSKKSEDRARAESLLYDVEISITDRLKKDVSDHYYVLTETWQLIYGGEVTDGDVS